MTQPQPTRLVSQPLVVAWASWILISWLLNLSLDFTSFNTDVDSTLPAVRRTLQSILVGLGIVWPVWRLSQPPDHRRGWRTVNDMGTMLVMLQVVVYPLGVLVQWRFTQFLYIDLTLIVCGIAFALAVWDKGVPDSTLRRIGGMTACLGILLGGPLIGYWTGHPQAAQWSPITTLWHLTDPNPQQIVDAASLSTRLCVTALAELAFWVWVIARRAGAASDSGP